MLTSVDLQVEHCETPYANLSTKAGVMESYEDFMSRRQDRYYPDYEREYNERIFSQEHSPMPAFTGSYGEYWETSDPYRRYQEYYIRNDSEEQARIRREEALYWKQLAADREWIRNRRKEAANIIARAFKQYRDRLEMELELVSDSIMIPLEPTQKSPLARRMSPMPCQRSPSTRSLPPSPCRKSPLSRRSPLPPYEKPPSPYQTSPSSCKGSSISPSSPAPSCQQSPAKSPVPVPMMMNDAELFPVEEPKELEEPEVVVEEMKNIVSTFHQVSVKVLAIRDLAGNSGLSRVETANICVELALKHNGIDLNSFISSTKEFVLSERENIEWDEKFTHEVCKLPEEQRQVIDEWVLEGEVKSYSNDEVQTIGKVNVPLYLLEMSFASQYAMSRWFPLEKPAVEATVRGELKLQIALEQVQVADTGEQILKPYISPVVPAIQVETKTPPVKKRGVRKTAPKTSKTQKFDLSSKGETIAPGTEQKSTLVKSNSTLSSDIKSKHNERDIIKMSTHQELKSDKARAKPAFRRIQAFSPPSSPSSVSSLDVEALSPDPSSPNKQKYIRADMDHSSAEVKSFLKRKPHKIVIEKLDWSRVTPKTSTRWEGKKKCSSSVDLKLTRSLSSEVNSDQDMTSPTKSLQSTASEPTTRSKPEELPNRSPIEELTEKISKVCEDIVENEIDPLNRFEADKIRYPCLRQAHTDLNAIETTGDVTERNDLTAEPNGTYLLSTFWEKLIGDKSGRTYTDYLSKYISMNEE